MLGELIAYQNKIRQEQYWMQAMAQQQNVQNEALRLGRFIAYPYIPYGEVGKNIIRCSYCGRTNQMHGKTSCDGCGAPR